MAKVVLVEDDVDLRNSLADYLTVAGHDVSGFGSAVELYQRLAHDEFDAAVVDVQLPHYDGFFSRPLPRGAHGHGNHHGGGSRRRGGAGVAGYRAGRISISSSRSIAVTDGCHRQACRASAQGARGRLSGQDPDGRYLVAGPRPLRARVARRHRDQPDASRNGADRAPGALTRSGRSSHARRCCGSPEPRARAKPDVASMSRSAASGQVQAARRVMRSLQTVHGAGFLFAGAVKRV